jgi:hypothetical protein
MIPRLARMAGSRLRRMARSMPLMATEFKTIPTDKDEKKLYLFASRKARVAEPVKFRDRQIIDIRLSSLSVKKLEKIRDRQIIALQPLTQSGKVW